MFKEDLAKIGMTKKDIKSFSRLVGGIFLLLGILFWWKEKHFGVYMLWVGGFLLVVGEVYYKALTPIYKAWMFLSVCMGFVMSRVILSIVYFLVMTPISLMMRLCGKRFIDKRFKLDQETYWLDKEDKRLSAEDYEKQY